MSSDYRNTELTMAVLQTGEFIHSIANELNDGTISLPNVNRERAEIIMEVSEILRSSSLYVNTIPSRHQFLEKYGFKQEQYPPSMYVAIACGLIDSLESTPIVEIIEHAMEYSKSSEFYLYSRKAGHEPGSGMKFKNTEAYARGIQASKDGLGYIDNQEKSAIEQDAYKAGYFHQRRIDEANPYSLFNQNIQRRMIISRRWKMAALSFAAIAVPSFLYLFA
ncbi:hypothetical protein J4N45_10020 [Vibrio sp. SCSIO 43140]|uniref:hypothetical protein n=1 Tax=Vibrio sp. SCSIO 43140 TaxID=2819100 RepID=UPI00207655E0|nr:hypothetical protein [Vibrio sp. SCSIO 43140]USD58865.1 hypothetical protein J4N45_10020 [Vibrio sp. SCSIO 43140]